MPFWRGVGRDLLAGGRSRVRSGAGTRAGRDRLRVPNGRTREVEGHGQQRLRTLSKTRLATGRCQKDLRLRLHRELVVWLRDIAVATEGATKSDMVRGAVVAAKEDVLDGRARERQRQLEAIARAVQVGDQHLRPLADRSPTSPLAVVLRLVPLDGRTLAHASSDWICHQEPPDLHTLPNPGRGFKHRLPEQGVASVACDARSAGGGPWPCPPT